MRAANIILSSIVTLATLSGACLGQPDAESVFRNPPAMAKPHTWWHWMNGNVTREGITADLEAMKKIGLGGAQIFNVSESIPDGPAPFMSPQWQELFVFAVKEADRLGLEVCVHNCAGWSSSGGPWVKPEHAMQMVVTSEIVVEGPKHFEQVLTQPETRHGYYKDIAVLAFPTPKDSMTRLGDMRAKAGYEYRYDQQPSLAQVAADAVIKRETIVDLTRSLGADGKLTWDAPAGSWTVVRFGHTPTGAVNAPSPVAGRGLECDKLSREAFDAFWAGMMGPMIQKLGPLAGKVLNNALIDSYEVGGQNWTPKFRQEFTTRRQYDPLMFLPVLTGRVVDSGEVSERFLWDFRRTIGDLFADNYYTYFSELCRKNGMLASIEPYDGPFECMLTGRDADIPMGEFWVGGGESNSCKLAASVAHVYGMKLVGAEAFTADPNAGRWQNHPAKLKAVGDLMYTTGINRYIIHRYAHQPWMDKVPGMTMGQWGTHFERTTTWWEQGAAWVKYLTRCQALLQEGRFCADVLYLTSEASPNGGVHNPAMKALGYDYDACNPDVLMRRISVKDGRLVLPDGMSYRVLVLPNVSYMTPQMVRRLSELAAAGAVIVGKPPAQSPSLSGSPKADESVAKFAQVIWGDAGVTAPGERTVGKGRVVWGKSPEEVLAGMGVKPDCEFSGATGKVAWIHRTIGDAEVYFVSSQKARSQEVLCTFRVSGKAPELWSPDTGEMTAAAVWSETGGRTSVPIRFDPSGSVFVVFRKAAGSTDHLVAVRPPGGTAAERMPKIEIVKATYEATDGAGGADVTAKVAAMAKAGEVSIPASNSVFGDPAYLHVKRLRIEYKVDGKAMTRTAEENQPLDLVEPGPESAAAYSFSATPGSAPVMLAHQPGVYELTMSRGGKKRVDVADLPQAIEVTGAWKLTFPDGRGAPAGVQLDTLMSWTDHADAGVKYFSGTAVYEKEFDIPAGMLGSDRRLFLDLGGVKEIAEVTLNGADLGVWWKPPYAADFTGVAKAGKNTLRIRVTNLWVNRLIGDEQYPDDCEWNGKPLKKWPDWMVNGAARPVKERLTFTTWKHYTKDSTLLPSGLIGPVMLRPAKQVPLGM